MAKNLTQYINDVRDKTRIYDSNVISDTLITKLINQAKNELSLIAPFALVYSFYSSKKGKAIYYLPKDIQQVLSVFVYPYAGTVITATIAPTENIIPVQSTADFPDRGYLILGEHPLYEIVSYTGKTPTSFTGVSRGLFGTEAQTWLYDPNPNVNTPIRGWEQGAKWLPLSKNSISVSEENEWFYDLSMLENNKTIPTSFAVKGNALVLDVPFYVNGFANIRVDCLIVPPNLVNFSDVVYGLPDLFEDLISYSASSALLDMLGGEDAVNRSSLLKQRYSSLLGQFQKWVEETVRGVYGAIKPETYRQSTTRGGKRSG